MKEDRMSRRKKDQPADDSDDITPLYLAERAAREFVEAVGADAVVIVWTTQNKRATRYWRHQIGNAMLCNALIEKTAEQQEEQLSEVEEEEEDE
jgi:hypothetical protein